jgi:hypothetical protein
MAERSASEKRSRDLNRLRKLIAVEEGHKLYDTAEEAGAAANLIQEIVTRLKESAEGFTDEELEELRREAGLPPESKAMVTIPIEPGEYGERWAKGRVKWTEELCVAVAESLFCMCLADTSGSNLLYIVGKQEDASLAAGLFRRLARTGRYLLDQDKPKTGTPREELEKDLARMVEAFYAGQVYNPYNPEVFASSYLIGYSNYLVRRLYAKRVSLERQLTGASTALVRAQRDVVVYAEEVTGGKHLEPEPHPELDEQALKLGMRRGATVNLEGGELPAVRED